MTKRMKWPRRPPQARPRPMGSFALNHSPEENNWILSNALEGVSSKRLMNASLIPRPKMLEQMDGAVMLNHTIPIMTKQYIYIYIYQVNYYFLFHGVIFTICLIVNFQFMLSGLLHIKNKNKKENTSHYYIMILQLLPKNQNLFNYQTFKYSNYHTCIPIPCMADNVTLISKSNPIITININQQIQPHHRQYSGEDQALGRPS